MQEYFNLSKEKLIFSCTTGFFGCITTKIFGEFNDGVFALIILMIIDFISGLIVAALFNKSTKTFNGKLSSKICLIGISKKIVELFLVAVGYQAEILLSGEYPIKLFATWALCTTEIISICENAVQMGILPKSLQKILEKVVGILNDKIDIDNNKKGE